MSDIRLSVVITLHKDLELIDQPAVFSPDHIHALVFLGCSSFPEVPDLSFLAAPMVCPFGAMFGHNIPLALILARVTPALKEIPSRVTPTVTLVRAPELDPL